MDIRCFLWSSAVKRIEKLEESLQRKATADIIILDKRLFNKFIKKFKAEILRSNTEKVLKQVAPQASEKIRQSLL